MSLKDKQSGKLKRVIPPLEFIRDSDNSQTVFEILERALADEAVLSMKTKNAKWNLCGTSFFELCTVYEAQYKQLETISSEIVNMLQMLNSQHILSLSNYLSKSRLTETPEITPDAFQLFTDHESVIRLFREDYRNCSKIHEDVSTCELLVSFIRKHEKMAWMLRSYIQNNPIINALPALI
jgi:starvation-inducible DNA-binding protein